ncbi:hypothetical protein QJS10_CPB15g01343 [Acorus calamus]|uniref:26S proteasome non-ATPase regulatory subunit 10 n=1 Tax=Acorus calamus TaxID=4465 RepID=A0AAV9D8D5_ACOCL|nr:hypothetical protein QJS10_CPB15g01343 [Acorus calamus]
MEMEIDIPEIKDSELFGAAESGNSELFRSLSAEQLAKARSLRNEDERTLLHVAASSGHVEASLSLSISTLPFSWIWRSYVCVVRLLSENANPEVSGVNSTDEEGWAPIHSAASSGHTEVAEILLNKGANVNLANGGGRTALHYAASKGWLKMAEILISHGAKLNKKDKVGCTPLHRAASTGSRELCEFLIEEGADIDPVDKSGQTPLMHAVICENKEVAFLLIRHGADVDMEDKEGYTVLGRASNDFRPALVEIAKAMQED